MFLISFPHEVDKWGKEVFLGSDYLIYINIGLVLFEDKNNIGYRQNNSEVLYYVDDKEKDRKDWFVEKNVFEER